MASLRRDTFPGAIINLEDRSARTVVDDVPEVIHTPLFFTFAERGTPNVPQWNSTSGHQTKFGSYTFDKTSPYWTHQSYYLTTAMGVQPVYLVRVVPADAKVATQVLEAVVTEVEMTQYQKDILGNRLKDSNGDYIPVTAPDGVTPIKETGLRITYRTRPLASNEDAGYLEPVTTVSGGVTTTVYPIWDSSMPDAGKYGNRIGMKVRFSKDYTASTVEAVDAMVYRFSPVELGRTTNIATPILDAFLQQTFEFTLKNGAKNPNTNQVVDLPTQLNANYSSDKIPFIINVYDQHVKLISERILELSPELDQAMDPFRLNIFSNDGPKGLYDHVEIIADSVLNDDVILYHVGGSDGTLTRDSYENLVTAYLGATVFPEIVDNFKYPVTHLYDSGFKPLTKDALIDFLGKRSDVKIDLVTQVYGERPNTKAEDQSMGAALRGKVLLHPESTVYGTQAVRASIYQQVGQLASANTIRDPFIPLGLDRLYKRCLYEGAIAIKGTPKGRPNSEITLFDSKTISWTSSTDEHKQLNWDSGLNYCQACNRTTVFYPDLRSVYPIDTSLLSSDTVVDGLVYLYKIVYETWTIFAGREEPPATMYNDIALKIDTAIIDRLKGRLNATTTVYQTAVQTALGYETTVEVSVSANMPNRRWSVRIPVSRA